jgi:hypothetical protein
MEENVLLLTQRGVFEYGLFTTYVIDIILNDAKRVNPDVLESQSLRYHECIGKCLGKILDRNVFIERIDIVPCKFEHLDLSPLDLSAPLITQYKGHS